MILKANKDKKLRAKLSVLEIKKLKQKYLFISILNNKTINNKEKAIYLSLLNKQQQETASKTKIINKCLLTYKSRVMYKKFKINRMKLKDMLQMGILPGYKKAAW